MEKFKPVLNETDTVTCPRCLGKGYVDAEDIKRLDRVNEWGTGPWSCAYCEGKGNVEKEIVEEYDPSDLSIYLRAGKVTNVLDKELNLLAIDSFEDFIKFFKTRICEHFVFRGVSDYTYGLKSKVGRSLDKITKRKEFLEREETLLELFKCKATAHTGMQQLSEWQWIVLAQHYGLSTRLLDWTENPLVALYFASEKNFENDGAIYCWHFSEAIHLSDYLPLQIKYSGFFIPPYLTNRIIAQSSIFSISTKPWKEFQEDFDGEIMKFRITKNFKKELKKLLPRLGINRRTIFSDLDSYATDIDEIFNSKNCPGGEIFNIPHKKPKRL